mmetsp:Transcript_22583/g.52603  ORF Transcript_22583/g.52603 Transcript_22583/m.52603 type:complete len:1114 (+) Transcript_22583:59-3400(+)
MGDEAHGRTGLVQNRRSHPPEDLQTPAGEHPQKRQRLNGNSGDHIETLTAPDMETSPDVVPTGIPISLPSSADWAPVVEKVKNAIVAIRVTGVRSFEDTAAGVWDGTGFVVCMQDPTQSLILTNRHIIGCGPIRARATFYEHEELRVWPIYRDPVHDFGLLQFDATQLRFTPKTCIPLAPKELLVGAEVLVIGNDNAEKIQILPATIARVDRNCPEYGDNYDDENTFYAGAGSNTSGGSSGSPVIARSGNCIALNAAGANEGASAFFLPLDRAVYVLQWLQSHREQAPLPPRGTIFTKFLFRPFDFLRRLGFTEVQEKEALSSEKSQSLPQKGLLVVESSMPETEGEEKLRPGDVLLKVDGEWCGDFTGLEECLDRSVGKDIDLYVSRAGDYQQVSINVADLHELIPYDFVECAGGVFHLLSYHACKRFHIPIRDRGVFLARSGFAFGLELPQSAVITAIAGRKIRTLSDFEAALAGVADGVMVEVHWYNPMTNERRRKSTSVRMERTMWPAHAWHFSAERPNTWKWRPWQALPEDSAGADGDANAEDDEGSEEDDVGDDEDGAAAAAGAESPARAATQEGGATPAVAVSEAAPEPLGYPISRDPTISHVQPMICTVITRVAHEYATDFLQSDEERKVNLVLRYGVGLVVDAERGYVLTDRYTVPQPLVHVELTFAQTITVNAVCLFLHPQHNLAVLHYDTSQVQELPVRAVDLWDPPEEEEQAQDGSIPGRGNEELATGEVLCFVSLHADHQLSAKRATVGSIYLNKWPFPEPPAYRERNLEVVKLNDSLQGLGGLLVDLEQPYKVHAWFAQFPAGKKRYVGGVLAQVLIGMLTTLGLRGSSVPSSPSTPLLTPAWKVPVLGCEFEELSLAKARRDHGMPLDSARELVASCSVGRRQVLRVSRITSGGQCDGRLMEGDLVLRVAGQSVARPREVERLMEQTLPGEEAKAVVWQVLRSRKIVEASVVPDTFSSDGTERLVVFNGAVLRPTLRAVAERGGPALPHTQPGRGLYFWYIFPGSPADTFGLLDTRFTGWLMQVNDSPTDSIQGLLDVIQSGVLRDCEWLRCKVMDTEGRMTVRTLQPDPLFWPTVELVRKPADGSERPTWVRIEHGL